MANNNNNNKNAKGNNNLNNGNNNNNNGGNNNGNNGNNANNVPDINVNVNVDTSNDPSAMNKVKESAGKLRNTVKEAAGKVRNLGMEKLPKIIFMIIAYLVSVLTVYLILVHTNPDWMSQDEDGNVSKLMSFIVAVLMSIPITIFPKQMIAIFVVVAGIKYLLA